MGSDDKGSISYPKQKVNLPAYWIDKYEVTNMEFLDFSLKTGYVGEGAKEGKDWRAFFTPATPEKARLPVIYISWNDAATYCKSARQETSHGSGMGKGCPRSGWKNISLGE